MMSLSAPAEVERAMTAKSWDCDRRVFDLGALFGRVERFDARRNRARTGAVIAPPRRLDADLLEQGVAFEAAWAHEVDTLIAMKRLGTPQAVAAAQSARATTARVAERIEAAGAVTLEGLKVKARAILWRRNGAPLGIVASNEAPVAMALRQDA
jgi:hypothetical protein